MHFNTIIAAKTLLVFSCVIVVVVFAINLQLDWTVYAIYAAIALLRISAKLASKQRSPFDQITDEQFEQAIVALYGAGNNDTMHDMHMWWKNHGQLWDQLFEEHPELAEYAHNYHMDKPQ